MFCGFCGAVLLASNSVAFCQTGLSNARSFGLGGAYTALASGVDAARWNPANLGLHQAPNFSIHFASFGAGVYNNAFSKGDYDLYNGAYLNAGRKTEILSRLPADGWRFNFAGETDLFGFSYRHCAVAVGLDFASDARLARDFLDLILNGNKLNRRYNFSGTGGGGLAMLSVGFSYGRSLRAPFLKDQLKKFSAGGTVKYLRGLASAEVVDATGSMITKLEGFFGDARATVRRSTGGNGLALDLGAAAMVNDRLSLGLSLRHALGFIHWRRNAKEYKYGVAADSLTAVEWASAGADSVIQHHAKTRDLAAGFTQRLPAAIHIGASYNQGRVLLSGELVQGFENRLNASTTPELRLGAEAHFLKYLLPRLGLSLGGNRSASSAIGVGLVAGSFQADVAVGTWGGILPFQSKGLGFAFGMSVGLGQQAESSPPKPSSAKPRNLQ